MSIPVNLDRRQCNRQNAALAGVLLWLATLLLPAATLALDGQININTATVTELEKLPFVGQARAQAIVEHRRQHGPFVTLESLLASEAIGESTLAAIQPYLTLTGPTTLTSISEPLPLNAPGGDAIREFNLSRHISIRPGEMKPLPDGEYFPVLLHFVKNATRRIELAMFLFKTTKAPDNRPAQLVDALSAARQRGVTVEVLLEKSGYDDNINKENERVARLLRKNRVKVRFDTPATTTHAKLALIDGRYVFIGSHNLTQSALAHNHELSLLIDSTALARELADYLARIKAAE